MKKQNIDLLAEIRRLIMSQYCPSFSWLGCLPFAKCPLSPTTHKQACFNTQSGKINCNLKCGVSLNQHRNGIKLPNRRKRQNKVFLSLPTILLCIVGDLSGERSVYVAAGVSDMWQLTWYMWRATGDTWHLTPFFFCF